MSTRPRRPSRPGTEVVTAPTRPGATPTPKPERAPVPAGPPPVLAARGVKKVYGDLPALAPLDVAVADGEAVVLIGHNGSGKTTFLRMAAGLLEPSGGAVLVGGHPAGSLEARAALSYLSDSPTFYDDLSVWEHLEYVARLHGMDEGWEQRAADLLGHLGIYERGDDLPSRFSRGLRQKAQIALALLRPFEVLCVDEPFVGLDAAGKTALLELLDEVHDRGAALVVATHELDFVHRPTVSRCLALRDGELIHDGPTTGIDVLSLVG